MNENRRRSPSDAGKYDKNEGKILFISHRDYVPLFVVTRDFCALSSRAETAL